MTEFSVHQDLARTYAGTHTTTEQRRQRLLSFQHFLQIFDLGIKPPKTVQPFEPHAPKISHISTVNSKSSNSMEHAFRLIMKKITVCIVKPVVEVVAVVVVVCGGGGGGSGCLWC